MRWLHTGPPKSLVYRVLAVLWIFPSTGAIWILALNWKVWRSAPSFWLAVKSTLVEQWIALAVLLAHGLWLFLAGSAGRPPAREE